MKKKTAKVVPAEVDVRTVLKSAGVTDDELVTVQVVGVERRLNEKLAETKRLKDVATKREADAEKARDEAKAAIVKKVKETVEAGLRCEALTVAGALKAPLGLTDDDLKISVQFSNDEVKRMSGDNEAPVYALNIKANWEITAGNGGRERLRERIIEEAYNDMDCCVPPFFFMGHRSRRHRYENDSEDSEGNRNTRAVFVSSPVIETGKPGSVVIGDFDLEEALAVVATHETARREARAEDSRLYGEIENINKALRSLGSLERELKARVTEMKLKMVRGGEDLLTVMANTGQPLLETSKK